MAVPIENEMYVLSDSGILIKYCPELQIQKKGGKKHNIFKTLSQKLKGSFSCIGAYLRRNRIDVYNSLSDTNKVMDAAKVERQNEQKNKSKEGKVILEEGNDFSCELVVNTKTPCTVTLHFKTATDFCVHYLENGIYVKPGCPAEWKQSDLSSWKSISLCNSCESLNVNEILHDDDSNDLMSYSEDYEDTKLVSFDPFINMDNDPTEKKETLSCLYSAKVHQESVESSGVEWLSDMSFYHHSSSETLSCDVSHDNKDSGNFVHIHNTVKSYEAHFMMEFHSSTSSTCDKFCSSLLSNKQETDNGIQNKKSQCSVCSDDMLSSINKTPVTATENDEKVENDPKHDSLNYLNTSDGYTCTSSATSEENFGVNSHISIFHRSAFYWKIVFYVVENVSMAEYVACHTQNLLWTGTSSCLHLSWVNFESCKSSTHKHIKDHCNFISKMQCSEENGKTCYVTKSHLCSDSNIQVVLNSGNDNAVFQVLVRENTLCSEMLTQTLCSCLPKDRFNQNFCAEILIFLYKNIDSFIIWKCKQPCDNPLYLLTLVNLLETLHYIVLERLIENIIEGQEEDANNITKYIDHLCKDSVCRSCFNKKLFRPRHVRALICYNLLNIFCNDLDLDNRHRALICYNLLTIFCNDLDLYSRHRALIYYNFLNIFCNDLYFYNRHRALICCNFLKIFCNDLNLYNKHRAYICYNLLNIFCNDLNLCNGHDSVISKRHYLFLYKCIKCCISVLSKKVKVCDSSDKKNYVRDNSPVKEESDGLSSHREIETKKLSGSIYETSSLHCNQTFDVLSPNRESGFSTSIREITSSSSYISTRDAKYSSSFIARTDNSPQSPHCHQSDNSSSNNEMNDSHTFNRVTDLSSVCSIVSTIQTQHPSPSKDTDVSSTNNRTDSPTHISPNNKTHRSETNHNQQPTFREHEDVEDSLNINEILSYLPERQSSSQYTSNPKDHVCLYFKMVKNSDTNRFARRVTLDKSKQIQLKMAITKYFKEAKLDARGDLKKLNELPLLEMLSKIVGMPKSSSFFYQHFKIPEEFRIISVHPLQKGDVNAPQGLDQFFERVLEGDETEIETRMRIEWFRVITFQTYPSITGISTLQLARHGFYYTGHMTETRCYFCRQTYREWDERSDIAAIHRQISPDCPFLNGTETNNEPIHSHSSNIFHTTANTGSISSTSSHEGINSSTAAQSMPLSQVPSNSADQSQTASLPQAQLAAASLLTTTVLANQNKDSPQSSKSKSKKEKRRKRKEALARAEGNTVPPAASSPADSGLVEHEVDQLQGVGTNEPPASSSPSISQSDTLVSKSSTRSNTSTSNSGSSTSEPRNNPPPPGGLLIEEVHHHSSDGAVSSQASAAALPVVRDPNPTSSQGQGTNVPSSSNSTATNLSSAPPARQAERSGANPPGVTSAERLSQLDPLGINFDKPKYPAYAVLQTRINSYQGWPSHMTQTPTEMSRAGFFYAGYGDYARCFFCGGGLRNWDRNDDPWIEHARWFPRCAFLRNNKGDKYVARIQRRHQEEEAGLRPSHQLPPPIEQDMDTVQAQTLREMGYKNNDIQQAMNEWRNRLRPGRRMPPPMTAAALMDILFEMEEKAKQEQRSENRADENVNERLPQDNGYDDNERQEMQVLQEEFIGLNDTLLCKICRDKEVAAAFLPCGHLVCCLDCAPAMRRCPVCDEIIKGTVKTYFS